ncbi:MAG: DAK2 domain-containing protein, partial [Synergistaceae bacterium]|nr:DAK2 domain-containing protein [Synergistaceae bacterium]
LIPAYETYCENINSGMINALEQACKSAHEGVEYTKTIIATKGRASYLGERSIGHQDPGATSMTLTLEAILDSLKQEN